MNSIHPEGLANLIEDLLTKAESIVARDFAATKQETHSPENPKDVIIEAAAKKLGIPIK